MGYYDNKLKISYDNEKTKELFKEIRNGNKDARKKLIIEHIPFVNFIASLYNYSNIFFDDLVEYGIIGLIKSIDGYDYNKDICFTTYAGYYINREIKIFLKHQSKEVIFPNYLYKSFAILKKLEENYFDTYQKIPTNQELLNEYNKLNIKPIISLNIVKNLRKWFMPILSLNDSYKIIGDYFNEQTLVEQMDLLIDENSNFIDSSLNNIVNEKIKLIINGEIKSSLSDKEKLVLDYYFGFNNERISIIKIAKELNCSKQYVDVLLKKGLNKIKQILLDNNIIDKDEYEEIKDKKINLKTI